jgi:hypothetical protein
LRGAALRDNVPVRPEELDFPATADPLPLCFAHDPTADFPVRDPFAEWPLPPDVRVAPGRASEVRRGCRAVADGCAGLRLRACGAGRLKWVLEDGVFALAAALWPLELLLANDSGLLATGLGAGTWSTAGTRFDAAWYTTGSGAAGSGYVSSCSLKREKYPPRDIAELA